MANFKLVLNQKGIKDLLKSSEIKEACKEQAEIMRNAAGPGYEIGERNYPERIGYAVYPEGEEAWRDNLVNNTLEKVYRR